MSSFMKSVAAALAGTWALGSPTMLLGADAVPPPVLTAGDNFVLEHVPPVPVAVAEATARYGESRPAMLQDWHPSAREVLISTRFGDTVQLHRVGSPGGARRQLTFFVDRVGSGKFLPDGKSVLLMKDTGGGEWFQLYRQDLSSGVMTLLTDGRSRNNDYLMAHRSAQVVYSSTRRNNKDTDLWLTDASGDPATSTRLLLEVEGGGWAAAAWSPDNRRLLVSETLSAYESRLWLVDVTSGARESFVPGCPAKPADGPVAYGPAEFSADGRSLFLLSDCGAEFPRLWRVDVATRAATLLSQGLNWGLESLALSDDGRYLAVVANEAGYGRLYVMDTRQAALAPVPDVPVGVVAGLAFRPGSHELGLLVNSARAPGDVYSLDVAKPKLVRWTEGETGGLDPSRFAEPELVHWNSFDGLELSGWLYRPDAVRYPGRRPVVVSIHGGPEGQSRPTFLGRANYLINELGVALLLPNVRGSSGYGKTFLNLDNGFHRDSSYKDIGALLDWVGTDPGLNAARILVMGGSYGGHMTWAVASLYNDRIRCSMPIVGMSNLVTFLERTEAYRRDLRRVEYGDERDPAMRAYLQSIAPINHLDSMRKPVFAVAGKNDPRVPWTESRQILDKLDAQGTPTWFMMATDEGHGYAKKKNADFLFNAEVMFVDRCLLSGDSTP